ncbi:ATPase, T2SS/T4P/T4SS family [Iamia sp.]|uniref:ATPase, T2SS/T4P/T4SS family n=1 Tax=Iamia sp. TaxID=2722710 RepID=UPI002BC477A3|nr:ATPase, T2SS/T4P/T4SS family [Iamia sp.]HXH57779.1 ATPase, T2SS/T4P/T4SS family [Iamia sp.]
MGPIEIEAMLAELLPVQKAEELLERGEVDVAHGVAGVGRFRINVFRQRGSLSLAVRRVVPGAPAIADLNLPAIVEKLAMEDSGLIVIAGPAASGKTTTVAALLDRVNATRARHIVTLEDPIEVLLSDKQSLVSQREIGSDAKSVADALRRVGRQNADVIFVSDISDPSHG